VTFTVLRSRLLAATKNLVSNGYITERGLARTIGLSQSHLHNILKGDRKLTPEIADRILDFMNISTIDLIAPSEVTRSALE
jgi:plasmid maintenance system antidote protein VapI